MAGNSFDIDVERGSENWQRFQVTRQRRLNVTALLGFKARSGTETLLFDSLARELAVIDEKRVTNFFGHPSDLSLAIYEHLKSAVDKICLLVNRIIKADAAIAIKLVWNDGSTQPVIRTFLRDSESARQRSAYDIPDYYSYGVNTAFRNIIDSDVETPYFASDDLLSDHIESKYENINQHWASLYNSTAVAGLPSPAFNGESEIIGFFCVDSKVGRLNEPVRLTSYPVRRIIELMAQHVYNSFRVVLSTKSNQLVDPARFEENRRLIGWTKNTDGLKIIDEEEHRRFQDAILLMEAAYKQQIPIHEREWHSPSLHAGDVISYDAEGVRTMTDIPDDELVFGFDESQLDPKLLAIVNAPVSKKEFVESLESISKGNPYATQLLNAAKKQNYGGQ